MSLNKAYQQQVDLMLDILPILNDYPCFGLKGGTAINLFIRNLPRFSVDIDLTYLPIEDRPTFLVNYKNTMMSLKDSITRAGQGRFKVDEVVSKNGQLIKLIVHCNGVDIKIEPNLVSRGTVNECQPRSLCERAEELFLKSVTVNVLSLEDVYAGKICAALNRQHPRDLFDLKMLFENEGITERLLKTFVIYLAGDARPMSEMLNPNLLDIKALYEQEFQGMTDIPVTLDELHAIRDKLISVIKSSLSNAQRLFLLSLKQGEPNWSLMPENIQRLPAIRWKLINIAKMEKSKHRFAVNKLREVLGL